MKKRFFTLSLAITSALCTLSHEASATAWMDFDDRPSTVLNLSPDSANPTILNDVTVVCPSDGYLVATSTATAFMRNINGGKSTAVAVFSISRQQKRDETYDTIALHNLGPNTYAEAPAVVQRVEACSSGESVTYYHTAHGSGGPAQIQVTTEGNSRLVVEFFNRRI